MPTGFDEAFRRVKGGRQTGYGPLHPAWHIVDEARDCVRTELMPSSGSAVFCHPMAEGLADKLAGRAGAFGL